MSTDLDRIEELARAARQAQEALQATNDAIEGGMCFHENTHRGGTIWTICDDCGQKWADDRGGFKKPTMPKAYGQSLRAIAALRTALQPFAAACRPMEGQ